VPDPTDRPFRERVPAGRPYVVSKRIGLEPRGLARIFGEDGPSPGCDGRSGAGR
jgi:hypothetical protein